MYITVAYALCGDKRAPHYWHYLWAQLAIYVLITTGTHLYYADNLGRVVHQEWMRHVRDMVAVTPYNRIAIMFASVVLIMYRWSDKPLLLRRSMWVIALALVAWLLFGLKKELRALYDIHPFIVLMLTHTLMTATHIHKARLFRHV